jgi:hypothetical protein
MELDLSDISPQSVSFTWGKEHYVLVSPSAGAEEAYKDAMMRAVRIGSNGTPERMDGMNAAESLLVSLCVHPALPDGTPRLDAKGEPVPVSQNTVRSWPAKLKRRLYKLAKEYGQFDEEDSVETIDKQIELLQKRKAQLEEGNSGPKPQPADGSAGSD